MTPDKAAVYRDDALAALAPCKTDSALRKWEDSWTSSNEYLNLPENFVREIERAFQKKLAWVMGEGVE